MNGLKECPFDLFFLVALVTVRIVCCDAVFQLMRPGRSGLSVVCL